MLRVILAEVCISRIFWQDIIDTWQYEAHLQHMKVSIRVSVCVCLYARATCRANVFLSVSRQAVLVMLCQERISSYGCQEHSLEKADDDE